MSSPITHHLLTSPGQSSFRSGADRAAQAPGKVSPLPNLGYSPGLLNDDLRFLLPLHEPERHAREEPCVFHSRPSRGCRLDSFDAMGDRRSHRGRGKPTPGLSEARRSSKRSVLALRIADADRPTSTSFASSMVVDDEAFAGRLTAGPLRLPNAIWLLRATRVAAAGLILDLVMPPIFAHGISFMSIARFETVIDGKAVLPRESRGEADGAGTRPSDLARLTTSAERGSAASQRESPRGGRADARRRCRNDSGATVARRDVSLIMASMRSSPARISGDVSSGGALALKLLLMQTTPLRKRQCQPSALLASTFRCYHVSGVTKSS